MSRASDESLSVLVRWPGLSPITVLLFAFLQTWHTAPTAAKRPPIADVTSASVRMGTGRHGADVPRVFAPTAVYRRTSPPATPEVQPALVFLQNRPTSVPVPDVCPVFRQHAGRPSACHCSHCADRSWVLVVWPSHQFDELFYPLAHL
ncbi:hypothetical protein C8Q78DRAFT_191881 [Trametes maxima]|nr:hypothetical protein C8Q78DRAFT_191881 [Trametes maxima]